MNNDSLSQSTGWARAFLILAWLLPCLGIVVNGAMGGADYLPPGVGYQESERTLSTSICLLALIFSGAKLRPSSTVGRLGVAFLVWSGISCLANESPFDSFLFWQVWLAPMAFFVAARGFHRQFHNSKARAALIHLPVAMISGIALLPILFEPVFFHVAGIFDLAGVLANWLLFLLPIALHDALEESGAEACLGGLAASLSLVAIAFSFSRAGWVLACLQLFFVLFLLAQYHRRRFALITLWILTGLAILIVFRQQFNTFLWVATFIAIPVVPLTVEVAAGRVELKKGLRLLALLAVAGTMVMGLSRAPSMLTAGEFTDSKLSRLKRFDNSSRARVELWKAAALMARAHPVLGVGPGDFSVHYPRFQSVFYYYSDSAHCAALEMASEIGIVGLGLFVWLIVGLLRSSFRAPLNSLRRAALLGLVFGLGYAQIDLAYQFGYLWLTVAVLFLYILPPPDDAVARGSVGVGQIGLGLLTVALCCYLLPPLRQLELIKSEKQTSVAQKMAQEAASKLPFWRHALVKSYQFQVQEDGPLPSPAETERVLKRGSSLAATHALVGELFLKQGNLSRAIEEYQSALQIDPHNYPFYYARLRSLGRQTSNKQLVETAEKAILETYSPEKLAMAHQGHRAGLQAQLHPVLYDIADGMNPYRQPLKTMPIYRYLYDFQANPRAAYGLGISLQTLGRTEEAEPYLEEARRMFQTSR